MSDTNLNPPKSITYLRHFLQISTYFNLLPPPQISDVRWTSDPPYLLEPPTIREGRVLTIIDLYVNVVLN